MGQLVQIGQDPPDAGGAIFRTTVTAPMPTEVPTWVLIFLAVVALVAILKR